MGFTSKLSGQSIFKKEQPAGSLLHMDGFAFQVSLTKKQHSKPIPLAFPQNVRAWKMDEPLNAKGTALQSRLGVK